MHRCKVGRFVSAPVGVGKIVFFLIQVNPRPVIPLGAYACMCM